MSLLESMTISNGDNRQVASETKQREAAVALQSFGRDIPFRGQLVNVLGKSNGERLEVAKLAWKAHSYQVGLISQKDATKPAKPISGYQAIVRGDTGKELAVVSSAFKIHQNSDILAGMEQLADAGKAQICYAGSFDGGRKIAAVAMLDGEFTLPNKQQNSGWNGHSGNRTPQDGEDKTRLFTVISGGHDVGTPIKLRGMAFRKWCGNGAFFTVSAAATYTLTHRNKLSTAELVRLERTFEEIRRQFEIYGDCAYAMQQVAMEREQSRLYVAELLKPGITAELAQRLAGTDNAWKREAVWEEVAHSLRGKQMLDAIIKEQEKATGFDRLGKNLVDAIVEQEGANGANLWTGYNGVTWYVDHKRGRSAETAAEAALFGEGAKLKERALATAMQFVN